MIIVICTATLIFTFLCGYFALRLKDKLYLILGFSAGAVIGLAFFDLLPTGLEISAKLYTPREIAGVAGLGFIIYFIIDWSVFFFTTLDWTKRYAALRGGVAAFCLSLHSFLDGVTIGLAFKVSAKVGLLINSVAPAIGAISTLFFRLTESELGILLALVSGFFLYLGASDFIPESRHHQPKLQTLLMTLLGVFTMFRNVPTVCRSKYS